MSEPTPSLVPVPSGLHLVPRVVGLAMWAAVVTAAQEACLVLDTEGSVLAASESAAALLCDRPAEELVGGALLAPAGPVRQVGFTRELLAASADQLAASPLLASVRAAAQGRGLVRVLVGADEPRTLDVVSTPLSETGHVVGALVFLSAV